MAVRSLVLRSGSSGIALSLLFGIGLAAGPSAAMAGAVPAREHGRAIFERHCAVCHGTEGRADTAVSRLLRPRPRNFADPVEMARVSPDRVIRAIKDGRPGTAMAGWAQVLSETDIGDVMDFVLGLAERPATPLSSDELSVASGRRSYERECAACHGLDGHPPAEVARVLNPPPRVFADPVEMARVDDGRMYLAIYRGRPGTAMGGRGELLAPVEIVDLMRYVRKLARPLPQGLTAGQLDRRVGELIYKQQCVACHGERGDGKTDLGAQLRPAPFDFTNAAAMAERSDQELGRAIVHGSAGTAMAPWEGVLNKDDVRRVVVYLRQAFGSAR